MKKILLVLMMALCLTGCTTKNKVERAVERRIEEWNWSTYNYYYEISKVSGGKYIITIYTSDGISFWYYAEWEDDIELIRRVR